MKKSIKAPFLLLMLLLLLLRFLAHFHDYMNEKRLMTLHIMYKEMRKFTILSSALKPIFFFFIYFFIFRNGIMLSANYFRSILKKKLRIRIYSSFFCQPFLKAFIRERIIQTFFLLWHKIIFLLKNPS